jgi:hypothetical protein
MQLLRLVLSKGHNRVTPSYQKTDTDLRVEVFTAMTVNNAVFWDVMLCGSCKNRCFEVTYHLHGQDDKIIELGKTLAVTSN